MSDGLDPKDLKDLSVLGLGWSIVGSLIFCIIGGLLLDRYFDTTPLWTLIGVGLGLVSAGYVLYELTLINRKDREAGPLGRALQSGAGKRRRQNRGKPDNSVH